MPIYVFDCGEHGEFEVWMQMNDNHIANCPKCQKRAVRVFFPAALHGDLPHKDKRMGKTRKELLDNVAKEGFGSKDWSVCDEPMNQRWRDAGFKEKEVVGWTPT